MRTAEFDAFGPWVQQVVSPEGLPRLYDDHPVDFDTARMILKVPRNIQRREASPDMDLYDHLVVAGESSLTVLSRRGDTYDATEIPYARIAGVHTSVSMLDGLLRVYDVAGEAPDGVGLDLSYNGVSDDVVANLARIIRTQAMATAPEHRMVRPAGPPLRLALDDLGNHDIALITAAREVGAAEELTVWATHLRTSVRHCDGVLPGLRSLLFPPVLHAAIVGSTAGEVHLVHRRPWVTAGRRPVHSVARTVIAAPRVEDVEVSDHPGYTGVQLVRVRSGRSVIEVMCPTGADTVDAVLTLLGVRVP